ncbi:MAG: hypothetical protein KY454_02280 [Actinobacteria bacterium]|nr:hypothetical protein [Actinomycetota bacterium]
MGLRLRFVTGLRFVIGIALLALLAPAAAPAGASPESTDPADGPVVHDDQHGPDDGHLPASSKNVELVGRLNLTQIENGIADVAAFGNYAYLNAWGPECTTRGGTGSGVHVVDISDPTSPEKVAFLPSGNSYPGEGVHVMRFEDRDLLVHNNETCARATGVVSGISLWDVTDPVAPVKLGQFGDADPAIRNQTFHNTHSVQGFTWQGKAYAVAQDSQDLKDVDIFDITPLVAGEGDAVLVAEVGLEDWPGAQGSYANGDNVHHHDMQQKVIGGHNYLLVSYWDAGQVLLNIDDPANPVFVTDSDYLGPDPETGFAIQEGNSHQSYWDQDGEFVISTDEDFAPFRTSFRITSGPHAGPYGAGEFGWTQPIKEAFPAGLTGTTVFGGSGCEGDRAQVPTATEGGPSIVVFSRGDCFFSTKVETGKLAGYEAVIIGNSHGGTRNGLLPDGFVCGSKGHDFDSSDISAICIGHRAMHLLFDDEPGYTGPEGYKAGGDLPRIGTVGASISASTEFDGWGYVRLHDAATLAEIDTYAIPEALDPAHATGSGNLTVHEVKTDPRRNKDLAYFSWYSAGLRVATFGRNGIQEVGHYIAEGGSDFWGVYPLCAGQCLLNERDQGRGRNNAKRPLILASDRDDGLWIFRYTGKE